MKHTATCAALLLAACPLMIGAQNAVGPDADMPMDEVPGDPPAAVTRMDPAVNAESVNQALRQAQDVQEGNVSVTTHAGTLVLSGEVSDALEQRRVQQIAEEAAPGARITTDLDIRAEGQAVQQASARLVQDVEQALQGDMRTATQAVSVSVDSDGVVGLHGLVPSAEVRAAVEQVATRVEGVGRVRNQLLTANE